MDNIDYTMLVNKINQIKDAVNISPKDSFATVELLTAAFPTGNNNNYIVGPNWYFWNGAWTSGGVYAPQDAKLINVEDVDGNFNSDNVEGALSEVSSQLADIATDVENLTRITTKYTVDSWEKVQEIVRAGLAEKAFKIGDQFIANYAVNPTTFDIIGINQDIPTDKRFPYSITLQAHNCIVEGMFDAPEALFFAETELAIGEQIFTLNSIQYKFTTTQLIPIGGQVFINTWSAVEGETYVPTKITTYAADRTTAIDSNLDVTAEAGTDTLLVVNNHSRCRYGSNNYKESAVKQWLNSNAASFAWAPKTNFDRKPTSTIYTGAGFLNLLDADLTAVLGAVDKQVAKNTVTDGGGQDLFTDKVFLLSPKEVYGANEGAITGESAYPYYSALAEDLTNNPLAGRIKYLSAAARTWWLRSPSVGFSGIPRIVYTTGTVSTSNAHYGYGLAPACSIV